MWCLRTSPVSARVLAAWLASSRAYISELEAKKTLGRVGGKFPLRANVVAYIEHLRRERAQDQSPPAQRRPSITGKRQSWSLTR